MSNLVELVERLRRPVMLHSNPEQTNAERREAADAITDLGATLKAERDLWKARAFAMFWRLPDKTIIGELREDVEKAKSYVKLAPDATIL